MLFLPITSVIGALTDIAASNPFCYVKV